MCVTYCLEHNAVFWLQVTVRKMHTSPYFVLINNYLVFCISCLLNLPIFDLNLGYEFYQFKQNYQYLYLIASNKWMFGGDMPDQPMAVWITHGCETFICVHEAVKGLQFICGYRLYEGIYSTLMYSKQFFLLQKVYGLMYCFNKWSFMLQVSCLLIWRKYHWMASCYTIILYVHFQNTECLPQKTSALVPVHIFDLATIQSFSFLTYKIHFAQTAKTKGQKHKNVCRSMHYMWVYDRQYAHTFRLPDLKHFI